MSKNSIDKVSEDFKKVVEQETNEIFISENKNSNSETKTNTKEETSIKKRFSREKTKRRKNKNKIYLDYDSETDSNSDTEMSKTTNSKTSTTAVQYEEQIKQHCEDANTYIYGTSIVENIVTTNNAKETNIEENLNMIENLRTIQKYRYIYLRIPKPKEIDIIEINLFLNTYKDKKTTQEKPREIKKESRPIENTKEKKRKNK